MIRSKVVVVGALSVVLAACGGSDNSQPPLMISAANQQAVASEVLVGSAQLTSSGGSIGGGLGNAPIVVSAIKPQLQRLASNLRRNPGAPLPADETVSCQFGGSMTTSSNGTTSAKITYNACEDTDGVVINGTVDATAQVSNSSISVSTSLDLTVKIGTLTIAESGDATVTLSSLGSDSSFDMTSNHLEASVKDGNTVLDDITLSDLTVHVTSSVNGVSENEKFHVDSSKLTGSFTVATTANITTGSGKYAASGSLTITGASGSTLTITVMGDESYTAAAGEGQVKLELNGTVTWTSWADLAAAASVGGTK